MNRMKGFGYCGLACCICSDTACPGCRKEGCRDKDWCRSFQCGQKKGHAGCWQCGLFPCPSGILEKRKVRAFARFLREYGEETLMDCLERNEHQGLVYHDLDSFEGDYDRPKSEEDIIALILDGLKGAGQTQSV